MKCTALMEDQYLVERRGRSRDYQENDKSISASITIKDLIGQNTEYNWILLVTTRKQSGIIQELWTQGDYHLDEKLAFVREFHEKTFDPDRVQQAEYVHGIQFQGR